MLETVLGVLALVLFLAPFALIVRKAGYSPLWVLVAFVPLGNLLALAVFTLSEWPIEKELQQLKGRPKSPADAKVETAWELKRLARRVALIEQLALPDGPNESAKQLLDTTDSSAADFFDQTLVSLQQFVDQVTDDEEKAFATSLLNTVKGFEGRMQEG
jgi:hypothetical protein